MSRRWLLFRKKRPSRQKQFAFAERHRRHERWFKQGIVLGTALVIVWAIAGTGAGHYVVEREALELKSAMQHALGLPEDRETVEADWKIRRLHDLEQTRRVIHDVYAQATPEARRLLDFGGFAPDVGVLRWGNYDHILLLPATVFLPDDHGRAYRLRPNVRSVWLRNFDLPKGLAGFFLMPDTDKLREAITGTGARIVAGSAQTTNSWGCRGPEPDSDAPFRGLILGDSNMQGLFLGDEETPAECLRRELQERLGQHVSILNTGHLGYSPEQMYYTLCEYGDRFRPHFIVFTFCSNDFGNLFARVADRRDEEEGRYWLDQITMYCRQRNILEFDTPIPHEYLVTADRGGGRYPGRVCDLLASGSLQYCNPVEAFVHEHLRLQVERLLRGEKPLRSSPLFNGAIGDAHMSAQGAALWGKIVGAHLALLLDKERVSKGANNKLEHHKEATKPSAKYARQDLNL